MIWIRADANSTIGTGHVMRCLSVAAALKEQGAEVRFILADESAVPLLAAKGQEYEILHSDYTDMMAELPALQALLESRAEAGKPAVCLVDSYFVTPEYLEMLGNYCKTVYMDDVFRFPYYPVDMVINYNIYGDLIPYGENTATSFLLGTSYAPLRKEFVGRGRCEVRENPENVLITTGGSDKYNLAGLILQAVKEHPELAKLNYHVVSGVFNTHLPLLLQMAEADSHITIHQNVTNMVELMEICDVAITAGGSTVYELCAVGVPIVCFSFVDNQEKIVETFRDKKLVHYGGNYLLEKEDFAGNIVDSLLFLIKDRTARENYSRMEQELVDGRGAERIARVLRQMEENEQ